MTDKWKDMEIDSCKCRSSYTDGRLKQNGLLQDRSVLYTEWAESNDPAALAWTVSTMRDTVAVEKCDMRDDDSLPSKEQYVSKDNNNMLPRITITCFRG